MIREPCAESGLGLHAARVPGSGQQPDARRRQADAVFILAMFAWDADVHTPS
jgi:hypothetical protein